MVLAGGACGCSRTRVIADLVAPVSRQLPCRALGRRAVQAGHDAAHVTAEHLDSDIAAPFRHRRYVDADFSQRSTSYCWAEVLARN